MFEKASYRGPAKYRRGIIAVNSFFEHHHLNKQAYPFNIRPKEGETITICVLWDEWTDVNSGEIKQTFSIVTVEGNELLATLHNNPKLDGPRMPLILNDDEIDTWLGLENSEISKEEIHKICKPFEGGLKAIPVRKLHGKDAVGNYPKAIERFDYPELALVPKLEDIL